jgi:hypothetical protein
MPDENSTEMFVVCYCLQIKYCYKVLNARKRVETVSASPY